MFTSDIFIIYILIYYQVVYICYIFCVSLRDIIFILFLPVTWPECSSFFVLGYRWVKKHIEFNRTFPESSFSFFFLPCLVIFAWNYVSVSFDISKKMMSELTRPPLLKGMDPPLRYMYIVVQCGLSSIVEYGATIYVVDCVKCSV